MMLVPPLTTVALVKTGDQVCPELRLTKTPAVDGLLADVMDA
jgi:hypothetical protein